MESQTNLMNSQRFPKVFLTELCHLYLSTMKCIISLQLSKSFHTGLISQSFSQPKLCTTEGVKKKETFCYYTTKILQYFVHKLQCVLRETTNRTTENYRSYYTKLQIILHKTTDCTTQNYRSYYTKLHIVLHKTTHCATNT